MRAIYLFITLSLGSITLISAQALQTLKLEDAYQMLADRFPVLKNESLLKDQSMINQELIDIARMPSVNWKAEGRLQSESVSLESDGEVMLPFEINLPLYSLRTYLEGQYILSDGGLAEAKLAVEQSNLATQVQQIKVQEFNLRTQINHLFLAILNLRAQRELIGISIQDLTEKLEIAEAGLEQGTLLESEVDKIRIGRLKLEAKIQSLFQKQEGILEKLEYLIGENLNPDVKLILPIFPNEEKTLNRPELRYFELQKQSIMAQAQLIDVETKPMVSAFAQAGVGYPNPLNLLDNGVAPYGLVGVQLNWKILDWNKAKKNKDLLSLKIQEVVHQEENFRFNLNAKNADYAQQVLAIQDQVSAGENILKLEEKILEQYKAQFDEGVIGSMEYIDQVNQVLKAKQDLSLLETELINIRLDYHNDLGTF